MTDDKPIIEAHDLTVLYGRKPALWNVDFELPDEQVIGIMGPNGSGKSTLLKAIMGVIQPTSGFTKVYDQHIDKVRSKICYVPQRQNIDWDFPANVWDIVSMGRFHQKGLFKRLNKQDEEIIAESLEKVNMLNYSKRQISQLSGGQQQRVFLARALAQQGDLFLMDEPFAGVDIATEEMIVQLLKEMRENGKTLVIVHHDLHTAQRYFDWLVLLNTRLVACGPVDEVFNDKILTETYGGKLTTMSKISQVLENKEFPIRHK
ncbi:MAG: metal ABC transporter ATP-binding protein [Bacteroidia bacterium]